MRKLLVTTAGFAVGFGIVCGVVARSRGLKKSQTTAARKVNRAPCPSLQLQGITGTSPALPTARSLVVIPPATTANVHPTTASNLESSEELPADEQRNGFTFPAVSPWEPPLHDDLIRCETLWPANVPHIYMTEDLSFKETPFKFTATVAQSLSCGIWPMPTRWLSMPKKPTMLETFNNPAGLPSALTPILKQAHNSQSRTMASPATASSSSTKKNPLLHMQAQVLVRAAKLEEFCCAIEACHTHAERRRVTDSYDTFLVNVLPLHLYPITRHGMATEYNLSGIREVCAKWKEGIDTSDPAILEAAATVPAYYEEF